jgi:hypothetical protein
MPFDSPPAGEAEGFPNGYMAHNYFAGGVANGTVLPKAVSRKQLMVDMDLTLDCFRGVGFQQLLKFG